MAGKLPSKAVRTSNQMPTVRLRAILAAALAAALGGCSALDPVPGFPVAPARWNAAVRRRGVDPADAPNPMEPTTAMTAAAKGLGGAGAEEEKLDRLRAALLDGSAFTFEYAKSATFSAAEAFDQKRGNCVSFTNLFIALGRSLGIRLHAALLAARGESERQGDLIVSYNHMVAVHPLPGNQTGRVYDFYRSGEDLGGRLVLLDDLAVAAIRASNLGIAALGRGEHAQAVRELETAVKLAPELGSLHANYGLARWRSGDVPGAFEAFRRGLEADPTSPPLHQNLAALYLEQGRAAEARAALAALDVSRASPYALIVRGDLDLTGGDPAKAISSYRKAASADPKLADPWIAIARAELARGRPEASRKAAKKALARDPANEEARRLADAP